MALSHLSEDAAQLAALAALTAHVAYVGSSKSSVTMWIEEHPPAPTLLPSADSSTVGDHLVLRVPTPGRLAELVIQYDAGLRPQPGHQQLYRWAALASRPAPAPPVPSVFGELFIYARTSGAADAEHALTITHALRRALLALADEHTPAASDSDIPALLHGHGPPGTPHCAFVALPHVGAPHADGHLLGVAVVFPRVVDAAQRQAVLRVLPGLEYVQTPAGRFGVASLTQRSLESLPWGLEPARWCGPPTGATAWTSVTPVLFDRFPRSSRGGILGATQALARHAGLPIPIAASAHQASPLIGVPSASAFRVRRTTVDPLRYVAHLTITFDRAVQGPILLGAGRFFGLGLFVPYLSGNE